ncbi:hypothetical protein DPMN_182793 [Dreissena polymorpha]|uniref:Apple domain-containing protein n=1 Tax=Dreissena polymorpha TaxID=45954 RepID=A0A9D4DGZ6_DREPO|nr:hypothetical protein DPMN_182793 [Dreissena polymorpha]
MRLSRVDIYEYLSETHAGVGEIKCYVNGGWETVWSTAAIRSLNESRGRQTFSPNLTKSCFSNRFNLTKATTSTYMAIDAVNIHGANESFKIEMGLTQGKNEAEGITTLSSNSTATWSPDNKGPYRYMKIQAADPQNKTLQLCEVQAHGHLQERTPYFEVFTGIAMSNPPVSTVFEVNSKTMCALICLRLTEPACVVSQFDQATQTCAMFNSFEHTHDPKNGNTTIVFKFADRLFET